MTVNPRIASWQGRTAWLVGASSGIGRATASALHRQGARVIVSARSTDALQAFVDEHPGSTALTADVCDSESLRKAASEIERSHGGVDLVLYCAGCYTSQRATRFALDEMLRHQEVNYVGALRLLDAVLPLLLRQAHEGRRAHLSLVSSVAGYRGLPRSLAYGPAKAALTHLAQVLYLDLQDSGIGVSVISPGFVETPMTAKNTFKMPALISAEEAASEILKGWARGDFEIHFPKRFTTWLKLMRLLSDGWYFKLVRKATGM